jgi:hypothetical protein
VSIRSSCRRRANAITRTRGAAIAALLLIAGLFGASGCAPAPVQPQDDAVTIRIRNDGARALRCVLLLGHWMSRDLGAIDPGAAQALAMTRDARDGSLFILSADGHRMMIENLVCGSADAWAETLGQVPLTSARESGAPALWTSCRAAGRVVCTPPVVR